ncbi:MAG TPA: hypothetical protein VI756_24810 [Blastocatellia bacterium]
MSLTLELTPDLEDRIATEAGSHGMTLEAFIQDVPERLIARLPQERSLPDNQVSTTLRSSRVRAVTGRIIGPAPPPKDRSPEFPWLSAHCDVYAGKWVPLDGGRSLAHGYDPKEVNAVARSVGIDDALLVRVEPTNVLPHV